MKLNLTGSQFGESHIGHTQQNAANVTMTDAAAILYVFNPYEGQFQDVGLRPFNYRFDTNFLSDIQEISDNAKRAIGSASALIGGLEAKSNLSDYIVPTPGANLAFRASQLSHHHRFILVLTDTGGGLQMPNTAFSTGNNKLRRIYSGYFMDEPFGRMGLGGNYNLNPNAVMVITHKTVVGMTTDSSQWGSFSRLTTHSSDEIFNRQATQSLTSVNVGGAGNEVHLMTPDSCLNEIDMTEEGGTIVVPGQNSAVHKWKGSNLVSSILEQPEQNVSHVVKGLIKYQDDQTNRNTMLGRRGMASFDDVYVDEGHHRMMMASHLKLPRSGYNSKFDLDVDSVISPVDIDNMVNHQLQIVPFDLKRPMYYETLDQFEASVLNQYSFLIASVVCPIISSVGLNDLEFVFEVANMNGRIEPNWTIHGATPNYPVGEEELRKMVRSAQVELESGIFRTIFDSKGDFGVAVKANSTGMTVVRLVLAGQGYNNTVDFEFPSCMGGLVSPLLGDAASRMQNSHEIESLFNIAAGKTAPSYFTEDDHKYADYANSISIYDDADEPVEID